MESSSKRVNVRTHAIWLIVRFRTESSGDVVGRFNERFMLTLGDCKSCLVCDDELNVLPLSSHARSIVPLPPVDGETSRLDYTSCSSSEKCVRFIPFTCPALKAVFFFFGAS